METKVLNHVDSRRGEIMSFVQTLIQTRSVTGEKAEVCSLLEELTGDGLKAGIVEPQLGRTNVVAKHTGAGGGPKVMMYSHIDTVPAGDLSTWRHPPFSGEIADGYI